MKKRLVMNLILIVFGVLMISLISAYNVGDLIQSGLETPLEKENISSYNDSFERFEIEEQYLYEKEVIGVNVNFGDIEPAPEHSQEELIFIKNDQFINEDIDKIGFWKRFFNFIFRKTPKNNEHEIQKSPPLEDFISFEERDYENIELPDVPLSPPYNPIKKLPWYKRLFSFITGNAIIGVPSWSFDGSKTDKILFEVDFTDNELGNRNFNFLFKNNMYISDSVNGIIYKKAYYLNEKNSRWVDFNLTGTQIGSTDWLREEAEISLSLRNYTDSDYSIFLTYACLKLNENWDCNDNKWVIYIVETGDVDYHGELGSIPSMEYNEVQDLNLSDLPSIFNQLNISFTEFTPKFDDLFLTSSEKNIQVNKGETAKLNFLVKNLGSNDLTNFSFEIDLGEQVLAEVVSADIPRLIKKGDSVRGSITLLFKEPGNWNFPLFLLVKEEEVDTSDNGIIFNINVSGEISENIENLNEEWNLNINAIVSEREHYNYSLFSGESNLFIISGTDRMRTIFGGYYNGTSINPTMKVSIEPRITEEALFSTPYISSIAVGSIMLTGDREVVDYYVAIRNDKTGEIYKTSKLESMINYYFNPKELIPNFEFCVNYTSQVVLVSDNKETIDVIFDQDSNRFNICDFNKFTSVILSRISKLEGEYFSVSSGFNSKYFEDENIQYQIFLEDPKVNSNSKISNGDIFMKINNYSLEGEFVNISIYEIDTVISPQDYILYKNIPLEINIKDKTLNLSTKEIKDSYFEFYINQGSLYNFYYSSNYILSRSNLKALTEIYSYPTPILDSREQNLIRLDSIIPSSLVRSVISTRNSVNFLDARMFLIDKPNAKGGAEIAYKTSGGKTTKIDLGKIYIETEEGSKGTFYLRFNDLNSKLDLSNLSVNGNINVELLGERNIQELATDKYLREFEEYYIVTDKPIKSINRGEVIIHKTSTKTDSLHFVWNEWNIFFALNSYLKFEPDLIKRTNNFNMLFKITDGGLSSLDSQILLQSYSSIPYFWDESLKKDFLSNSDYIFKIKDLTEDRYIYNEKISCSDYDWNSSNPLYHVCSSPSHNANLLKFNAKRPLPEFISGHYYSFYSDVENKKYFDKIVPAKPQILLFVDGYQLIANNPILRTRFSNLENFPFQLSLRGDDFISEKEYVPKLIVDYNFKNTFYLNNSVQRVGNEFRVINLDNLVPFYRFSSYSLSGLGLDYILDLEKNKYPLFTSISLTVIPLSNKTNYIKKDNFNCKIGRFEGICSRYSNKYNFIYFDELNKFIYNYDFTDDSFLFLEKYRDNPEKYDLVIYDILTEINKNPLTSLYPKYIFRQPNLLSKWFYLQTSITPKFGNPELRFDSNPVKTINFSSIIKDYDFNVSFELFDVLNNSVYIQKTFNFNLTKDKNSHFAQNFVFFMNNNLEKVMSLCENERIYDVKVSGIDSDSGYVFIPNQFRCFNDYFLLMNSSKDFLKKIPEVNSVIMGPVLNSSSGKNYPIFYESFKFGIFDSRNYYWWVPHFGGYAFVPVPFAHYEHYLKKIESGFSTLFSINPSKINDYDGKEEVSIEELNRSIYGDRKYKLDSDMFYSFTFMKFSNIYDYFVQAPKNKNTFDTELESISCNSIRSNDFYNKNNSQLILVCTWANVDELKVYQVYITKLYLNKSENDLFNLPDLELIEYKRTAEIILGKYLERYPPTPILNGLYS